MSEAMTVEQALTTVLNAINRLEGIACALTRHDAAAIDAAKHSLRAALPRWIPVEERLPEEGDEVLLFVPMYNECHVAAWQDGMGVREDGTCFDPALDPEIGFTHWMPFPAPPTQEEQE